MTIPNISLFVRMTGTGTIEKIGGGVSYSNGNVIKQCSGRMHLKTVRSRKQLAEKAYEMTHMWLRRCRRSIAGQKAKSLCKSLICAFMR